MIECVIQPVAHWPKSLLKIGYIRLILSMILSGGIAISVWYYPLAPLALAGFLVVYSRLLCRYPMSWLICLPALLPVMDFTPLTGRFFFDEFDLVVLTTVTVQLWQRPTQKSAPVFNAITRLVFWLYGIFYGLSLLRGLLPFQSLDANAFSNYYSHYNSLRVGKGVLWAGLLLPALQQALGHYSKTRDYLSYGILVGLTGVISIAIVERFVFTGVFDFSSQYRINALFSTMHTGGGHIESYLMLSLPFIAWLFVNPSASIISYLAGGCIFVAGLYVILVTFSRGAYIGFVTGFLVLLVCLLIHYKGSLKTNWKQSIGGGVLLLIVPLLAMPVFQGQLIKQRFSIFSEDKAIRTQHWLDAFAMMDSSLITQLLGMGLGSYPRTYFWLNTEHVVPATYKIENEANNNYLRLRSGDALFMGQSISVLPHRHYHLQLDVRTPANNMILNVAVCEKSLIYALRCTDTAVPIKANDNGKLWQTLEYDLNTAELGEKSAAIANGWLSRPVQLTLANSNGVGKILDTDNIKLIDSVGKNQIINGDFSKSLDHWFFTTEKHHPWHILNLWVQVFFDQGGLGFVIFALLMLLCVYHLCKTLPKNLFSIIFLAALCAFNVVGWVDSPFDAPRITLLFCLIVICSVADIFQPSTMPSKNANLS